MTASIGLSKLNILTTELDCNCPMLVWNAQELEQFWNAKPQYICNREITCQRDLAVTCKLQLYPFILFKTTLLVKKIDCT